MGTKCRYRKILISSQLIYHNVTKRFKTISKMSLKNSQKYSPLKIKLLLVKYKIKFQNYIICEN